VHGHHLYRDYNFDSCIGEVTTHPTQVEVLGLRNLTDLPWDATMADGEKRKVGPGRTVRIDDGTRIDFGNAAAVIEGRA